jgi:hypothetical protein
MYIRSQVGVGLASQGGKRYIRLLKCLRVGSVGFFENGQILTRVTMVEEGLLLPGLRWTGRAFGQVLSLRCICYGMYYPWTGHMLGHGTVR